MLGLFSPGLHAHCVTQATCCALLAYCRQHNVSLPQLSHGFTMSYTTDIPRQVGLAGSSAIVVAALQCLLTWMGLGEAHVPKRHRPTIALEAERMLGITAGLQDRVIQVMYNEIPAR
jgi:glucuronokinase